MGTTVSQEEVNRHPSNPKAAPAAPEQRRDAAATVFSASATDSAACSSEETKSGAYKHPHVYNVYGERINAENMMPAKADQTPVAQQRVPLSTTRVKSSIPKGGTDNATWEYPSPQMFYNALVRKGKGDGVREEDMDVVIAIHNNMNEKTWRLVKQWEDDENLYKTSPSFFSTILPMLGFPGESKVDEQRTAAASSEAEKCKVCENPTLLKFRGRPHDLSPKAWFKKLLGYGAPFDRHDWIVDRCGEKEQRYVIDFYHVEKNVHMDRVPGLYDHASIRSIFVDARPAIDDFGSLFARVRNIFRPTGQVLPEEQAQDEILQGRQIIEEATRVKDEVAASFLANKCGGAVTDLMNCADVHADPNSEEPTTACAKQFMRASFCMGSVLCPDLSQKFLASIQSGDNGEFNPDAVLSEMSECIAKSAVAQKLFADALAARKETIADEFPQYENAEATQSS